MPREILDSSTVTMRGGYRERAEREFERWAGIEKGIGTKAIRLPQPLAEAKLKLKAQRTKIADIQKALENVLHTVKLSVFLGNCTGQSQRVSPPNHDVA
ncbi:MAG TPA: hypothetical protein ENI48_04765 [Thioploca sp.]|nr:hypothetical protein [Thioploca sp.]